MLFLQISSLEQSEFLKQLTGCLFGVFGFSRLVPVTRTIVLLRGFLTLISCEIAAQSAGDCVLLVDFVMAVPVDVVILLVVSVTLGSSVALGSSSVDGEVLSVTVSPSPGVVASLLAGELGIFSELISVSPPELSVVNIFSMPGVSADSSLFGVVPATSGFGVSSLVATVVDSSSFFSVGNSLTTGTVMPSASVVISCVSWDSWKSSVESDAGVVSSEDLVTSSTV